MDGRQIKGGKASLPDNGTHVAFIAHWPAHISHGVNNKQLVDFTDILPTLCELGGVALTDVDSDGHSLGPVFRGEGPSGREWVYCHYIRNGFPQQTADEKKRQEIIKKQDQQIKQKLAGSFVRTSRYKLYGDGRFYDIRKDVEEKRILTELTPKQTDIRATLQAVHDEKPKWAYFAPSKN